MNTDGHIHLPDNTLIVFVDETGTATLNDPNVPLFGLGGCACLFRTYEELIHDPWLAVKSSFFGRQDAPLHAANFGQCTAEQKSEVASFFRRQQFYRLAFVITKHTERPAQFAVYQLVAGALGSGVEKFILHSSASHVFFVLESAEQYDDAALRYLRGFRYRAITRDGRLVTVKSSLCFMGKKAMLPGLEVADFVMNAACGGVRTRLSGSPAASRKDFAAVFNSQPPEYTHFMKLDAMQLNQPR